MPETFVTWEEQINNFTFVKEKEKYVLGQTRSYFHILSKF